MKISNHKPIKSIPETKNAVYCLCDSDGIVVYIGMTSNTKNRFQSYNAGNAHGNTALEEWICQNNIYAGIYYDGDDYKDVERNLIKENKESLFNLIDGGDQGWRMHTRKPWSYGKGKKCPTTIYSMAYRNVFGMTDFIKSFNVQRQPVRCRLVRRSGRAW
jgi:predicted GIY-YIG superfamily endonuclease